MQKSFRKEVSINIYLKTDREMIDEFGKSWKDRCLYGWIPIEMDRILGININVNKIVNIDSNDGTFIYKHYVYPIVLIKIPKSIFLIQRLYFNKNFRSHHLFNLLINQKKNNEKGIRSLTV